MADAQASTWISRQKRIDLASAAGAGVLGVGIGVHLMRPSP
jgi:hypothetical protein